MANEELRLYPWQSKVFRSNTKNRVVLAGRRSGKTMLFTVLAYTEALKGPQREIMIVCTTHSQAVELYFNNFTNIHDPLFHPSIVASINRQTRVITLINGSRITVTGSENSEALLGRSLNLLLIDEFQSIPREVFEVILQPCLADRNGSAVFSGTARFGDKLMEYYERGLTSNPYWESWLITTAESGSPASKPEILEQARQTISKSQFLQEYECIPCNPSFAVFPDFNRSNIIDEFDYSSDAVLHIGMDFNCGNMCCIIGVKRANILYIVDEIVLTDRDSNTYAMVNIIKQRYGGRQIVIYPDASGRNRNTASIDINNTNHSLLREAGFNLVFDHKGNPPIIDRNILINAKILSAAETTTLYVHSRCKQMIRSFQTHAYKNGMPFKDGINDHAIDAMSYLVWHLFSKRNTASQTSIYK